MSVYNIRRSRRATLCWVLPSVACRPLRPRPRATARATKAASLVFDKLDLRPCVTLRHQTSQDAASCLLVHRLASCLRKCLGSSHFSGVWRKNLAASYTRTKSPDPSVTDFYLLGRVIDRSGRAATPSRPTCWPAADHQRWPTRQPKSCASIDRPALAHLSHSTTALQPQTRAILPSKPAIRLC